jgi:cyclophilin family peptidyl-prolyl cis-trans isomerase
VHQSVVLRPARRTEENAVKALRFFLLLVGLLSSLPAQAAYPQVEFRTNQGSFVVELYPDKAPRTVANFLEYVNRGFYEGTIFHRVINQFMIQGGGLTPDLAQKPTLEPIPNEADNGLKNEPGTLAMARRLSPDSATAQFFINLADNRILNYYRPEPALMGYCVFGRVIRGMDVAEKIGKIPTQIVGKFSDVPRERIIIEKAALLETPIITEQMSGKAMESSPATKSKSTKKGKKRG